MAEGSVHGVEGRFRCLGQLGCGKRCEPQRSCQDFQSFQQRLRASIKVRIYIVMMKSPAQGAVVTIPTARLMEAGWSRAHYLLPLCTKPFLRNRPGNN